MGSQHPARGRHIPLFWRLFLPNALVLAAVCVVLIIAPANGRILALAGGLVTMLVINLALMRRAFAPLERLAALMRRIDPLKPGERLPLIGPASEVTELATAFNDMLDRLEYERRDSARRALAAQESERRHLAAELHDELGQTLTALVLQLSRVGSEDEFAHALATAEASLADVRRIARRLRPEALDDLGLVPALTNLCERLSERTGVTVERRLARDLPALNSEEQLVIYRVAQESLTNVVRHAGARSAEVRLGRENGDVVLAVRDDGHGLNGHPPGEGVRGMRERAVLIGAELSFVPAADGGTIVRLRIPVEDKP
jgi:two-component system sensor histidine kinase UhpB